MKCINMKPETLKFIKEKVGGTLKHTGTGKAFLNSGFIT